MNKYKDNNDRSCIISPKLNMRLLFLLTISFESWKIHLYNIMVKECKFWKQRIKYEPYITVQTSQE